MNGGGSFHFIEPYLSDFSRLKYYIPPPISVYRYFYKYLIDIFGMSIYIALMVIS